MVFFQAFLESRCLSHQWEVKAILMVCLFSLQGCPLFSILKNSASAVQCNVVCAAVKGLGKKTLCPKIVMALEGEWFELV